MKELRDNEDWIHDVLLVTLYIVHKHIHVISMKKIIWLRTLKGCCIDQIKKIANQVEPNLLKKFSFMSI